MKEKWKKFKNSKFVLWSWYTEIAIYQKLLKKYKEMSINELIREKNIADAKIKKNQIYFDLLKLLFFASVIFNGVIGLLNGIENVKLDLPEKTFFPSVVVRQGLTSLSFPFNIPAFLIPIQEVSLPTNHVTITSWVILFILFLLTLVILKLVITWLVIYPNQKSDFLRNKIDKYEKEKDKKGDTL